MSTRPTRTRAATYKQVDVVNVYLWGKQIGAVALDPTWGYYVFEYTPALASLGLEPAPLQMPTRQGGTFMFTDLPEITFKRLPAMLADILARMAWRSRCANWVASSGRCSSWTGYKTWNFAGACTPD